MTYEFGRPVNHFENKLIIENHKIKNVQFSIKWKQEKNITVKNTNYIH